MARTHQSADSETTANVLLRWFAAFGIVTSWVSDRGSHFKNELVKSLKETLRSSHHFTLAYCPWSNGTVEVVCRELLRATRSLLSEFQLSQENWPSVIPIIQSVLNNSTVSRLGNRCPLTVFTKLPQNTPITAIKERFDKNIEIKSISDIRMKQLINIERLQKCLEEMHKDVARRAEKKRHAAVSAHNRKTGIRPVNFVVGDFVLRGLFRRERGRKPSLRWVGPYRVVAAKSEYIFVIQDLLSGEEVESHGRRLKMFRNKDFEITEELKDYLRYQQGELLVIDRFDDIRERQENVELLVKWKGFGEEESDWVEYASLKEDVPTLINEYLNEIASDGTQRQKNIVAKLLF